MNRPNVLETSGGSRSAEALVRRAHKLLGDAGMTMSPSRVSRLVRQYNRRCAANGFSFEAFLANSVVELTAEQRRRVMANPDIARVVSYLDPTGEQAAANVQRQRGF